MVTGILGRGTTQDICIWVFPKIMVPPNHPILIGFSIINHPFWGTPIFGNIHIFALQGQKGRRQKLNQLCSSPLLWDLQRHRASSLILRFSTEGLSSDNKKHWLFVGCIGDEFLRSYEDFRISVEIRIPRKPTSIMECKHFLGGGFKHFLFSCLFGEMIQFWLTFFRWVVQPPTSFLFYFWHCPMLLCSLWQKQQGQVSWSPLPSFQPRSSQNLDALSWSWFPSYSDEWPSKNRGFYPPNHPFVHRVFPYKPSILGYHYFWKRPDLQKNPYKIYLCHGQAHRVFLGMGDLPPLMTESL